MQPIVHYNFSSLARPNELWAFNPFKSHYTLILKNLPFTTKWIEFHQIPEVIPDVTKTGVHPTLPVIVDSNNIAVQDSWKIAKYLETTYPDSPSIFHGAESLHYFFYQFYETNIKRTIFSQIVLHMDKVCGHGDYPYGFRQSVERHFSISLENFLEGKKEDAKNLQEKLNLIRSTVSSYTFLTGDKIGWSDLVIVGAFYMVEYLDKELLDTLIFTGEDDGLRKYYHRVMDELMAREKDHAAIA